MTSSSTRQCPACSSAVGRSVGKKNGFDILVCGRCRSIYTAYLPSEAETEDYDAYYTEANLTTPAFIQERVREIVGGFEPYRKTNRFLEIGFGAGTIIDEARRQGWEVVGTEVSRPACDHAKGKGYEVFHGELRAALYPDNHFDVVAASEILEHLADPAAELGEVARILRPGGLFWATTPSARSLSFRLMNTAWTTISPPEHTQLYSPKGVRIMLERAGFQKIGLGTSGLNPAEIANYYRHRENGNDGFNRVGTAYELNEKLTRSPLRRAVKRSLNGALNTLGLGDSLKIFAVKGGDRA